MHRALRESQRNPGLTGTSPLGHALERFLLRALLAVKSETESIARLVCRDNDSGGEQVHIGKRVTRPRLSGAKHRLDQARFRRTQRPQTEWTHPRKQPEVLERRGLEPQNAHSIAVRTSRLTRDLKALCPSLQ